MSKELDPFDVEATQQRAASANLGMFTVNSIDSTYAFLSDLRERNPALEIRPEQIECLEAIEKAREQGNNRALIQMATGLGKTTVVAADVDRYLKEKPDARVLFLCHQNDILDQAKERFEEIVGPEYIYGKFTGESKDYHEVTCLFASFQAMRQWREAFLENEFDYIVVDESHHAKARTYEPTLKYFKPDFLLGVTATPDRHDLKDIRSIFGKEKFKLSLEEALARNLLTNVDYHVITDEIADTQQLMDAAGRKLNYKQLDRTIFAPKRDEEIVEIIHRQSVEVDNPRRIIFCKSREQAEQFASYFEGALVHHSLVPKAQQDQNIKQFKSGLVDTLTVVEMFNEGIDIPDANQIIFLRSTESKTIFLQQLGRGLRKHPGKDKTQVLDFVASCDRLLMLNDIWRRVDTLADSNDVSDQNKDKMYVKVNNVAFNDSSRAILEILAEIEDQAALIENWQPDHSAKIFMEIFSEKERVPSLSELAELLNQRKSVSISILLAPFNGRYRDLRAYCGIEIPENWQTLRAFSQDVRAMPESIIELAKEHGLTIPIMAWQSHDDIRAISPEIKDFLIKNTHLGMPIIPDTHTTINAFRAKHRVGVRRLKQLIQEHNVPLETFRAGKVLIPNDSCIGPEAQAVLEAHIVPIAPKEIVSVTQMVVGYPISKAAAVNWLNDAGHDLRLYRFKSGPATEGLGNDLKNTLQEYLDSLAPEADDTDISINQLARELRVGRPILQRVIDEAAIEMTVKRFGSKASLALDKSKADIIRALPRFEYLTSDEGLISVKALGRELGLRDKAIGALVASNDIPTRDSVVHGQAARVVTAATADRLRDIAASLPQPAPTGAISVSSFAKKSRKAESTIRKLIEEAGINPNVMKFKAGQPALGLTQDQQDQLKKYL